VVLVVVLSGLPAQLRVRTHHNSPDTRAMATLIHDHAARGDVIVYASFAWSLRPTLNHYLDGLAWSRVPRPPDALLDRPAAGTGTLEATESTDPRRSLAGARRVWLIGPTAGEYGTPADPLAQAGSTVAFLRARYRVVQSWTLRYGRAALLVDRRWSA
jgi:hypothetical protein